MVDCASCGTGPSLLAFGNLETDMTPEQIEALPTVSNVDQDLQHEPDIREGYVLVGGPVKWVPYKPQGAKQMNRKGRWKAMNEYGGWDNCETPAQIWSGFISYEEMAAHIIAQREQIAALEARVKSAEELVARAEEELRLIRMKDSPAVYDVMLRTDLSTYRATEGQPLGSSAAPWDWAVRKWHDEVANRPLKNIHRRTLDDTWRQVIRHYGGNDVDLLGPIHDDLCATGGQDNE